MSEATQARDEGMSRADQHALDEWKYEARRAVVTLAYEVSEFTADDAWDRLDGWGVERPHEARALGYIMVKAHRDGIIDPSGRFVNSEKKSNHARPTRVWRSNLVGPRQLNFNLEGA